MAQCSRSGAKRCGSRLQSFTGAAAAIAIFAALTCTSASAQSLTPLKVGTMKSTSQTPDYFAKKHGIFEKNGLAVTLTEFTNGSNAIAAGQSGAVDIMVAIPGIAMVAKQNGLDLVAVLQIETAHDGPPDTGSLQVLATSPLKNSQRPRRQEGCGGEPVQPEHHQHADRTSGRRRRYQNACASSRCRSRR